MSGSQCRHLETGLFEGDGRGCGQHPVVNSELALPESTARLTVYANLHNFSAQPVSGTLKATISRQANQPLQFEQSVSLSSGETREVAFAPEKYSGTGREESRPLVALHDGHAGALRPAPGVCAEERSSDQRHIRFGIRSVTQHRDHDEQFPDKGKGGNFYLQVNGRDFLSVAPTTPRPALSVRP